MTSSKRTLLGMILAVAAATYGADTPNGADVMARHLDAIGSAAVRSAVKSRVVEGVAVYKIVAGGVGSVDGKCVVASQSNKLRYLLKIADNTYHGEQFIFDGANVDVASTKLNKTRSELANFLRGQDAPIRDGLLGGVLSTAWPALDPDGAKRFAYIGVKKINGKDMNTFRYKPRKASDLEILVYFDPQTAQHVRTTYRAEQSVPISFNDIQSAHGQPLRYSLTEDFSEFHQMEGLTLPTHYVLRFMSDLRTNKEIEWNVTVGKVLNNIDMDPRNFAINPE